MTQARTGHTATALADGRVLVTGGLDLASPGDDPPALRSTELFDPASATWTAGPSMHVARQDHSATILADGRVLVLGGRGSLGGTFLASAEVFDPATNAWSSVGRAPKVPGFHTATLLADGRVLVIGDGTPEGPVSGVVEVYDPATNGWTQLPSNATFAAFHTATLLADGTVLVEGGADAKAELPKPEAHAARFDPARGRWATLPDMHAARIDHAAVRLADGRVLVLGQDASSGTMSAEIFDPVTASWTRTSAVPIDDLSIAAASLSGGQVLAVVMDESGATPARASIFDGSAWHLAGALPGLTGARLVALADGTALVIGGEDSGGPSGHARALATTYRFDPAGLPAAGG